MSEISIAVEQRFPGVRLVSPIQGYAYLEEFDAGIHAYSSLTSPSGSDTRWLGVCHFQCFHDQEAKAAFESAVQMGDDAARVNLAHLLRMKEQSERASQELQRVDFGRLTHYDQVFFLRVKSIHEETDGNLRNALRQAEEAWRLLQGLPEFPLLAPSILSQLGILHGRIGRADRALWFLERSIQETTGMAQVKSKLRLATVLVNQGMAEKASALTEEVAADQPPDAIAAELYWLRGEIFWLRDNRVDAMASYQTAIDRARESQVSYEEFLCQLALACLNAFAKNHDADSHLKRAQELIADYTDQLTFRFREVLVATELGRYRPQHGVRELRLVANAFSEMGLLQEQGFVRLHMARYKRSTNDETALQDLDSLRVLARTLQNPRLLERELHLIPEMRQHFSQ